MIEGTRFHWEEALWSELDTMLPEKQFVACGEYISRMTQEIMSQLADRRRIVVVKALERDGWDATRFAEEVGSRRTTVTRLAEEGRALLRREAAASDPS